MPLKRRGTPRPKAPAPQDPPPKATPTKAPKKRKVAAPKKGS